jgi:alanyl-tRNA synthetase
LEKGLRLLDDAVTQMRSLQSLPGDVAFKLYDTYGFPIDLTQDILRSKGLQVDMDGFHQAMEVQREAARKAWVGSGDTANDPLWQELGDLHPFTAFTGYDTLQGESKVLASSR